LLIRCLRFFGDVLDLEAVMQRTPSDSAESKLDEMKKSKTQTVSNVELVWSSGPHEYQFVTLEVLLDANPIVVVNREAGLDKLEVELFGPLPNGWMLYKLPLDRLIDALIECRNGMKESKWREQPE
jgi:hypothetical protein